MSFWSGVVAQAKQEEKRKEEEKKAAVSAVEEQENKKEAETFGVTELEGTGYNSFKDLVVAYNKKNANLRTVSEEDYSCAEDETRQSKKYRGISELMGRNKTLG